jgi:hypothetical protein
MNSKSVTVVRASKVKKGGKGTLPARVVIWHRKSDNSYITHVEVYPPKPQKPYFVWGHYDMSKGEALEDFAKRVKRL